MSLENNRDDLTPCDRSNLDVARTVRTLKKISNAAAGSWLIAMLLLGAAQLFDLGVVAVIGNLSLTVAVGLSAIGVVILVRYLFGGLKPVRV